MDIQVPYRRLGPVDIRAAAEMVRAMPPEAWRRNTFRQDALADPAHNTTESILFKHEWDPRYNASGLRWLEEVVVAWADEKGVDPAPFMPIAREDTDLGPVYTFPDWRDFEPVLGPLVEQAIRPLKTAQGVITRLALVMLKPGYRIAPHIDGQPMAEKAHRIHVTILSPPGVEYKVGGRKFTMPAGSAFDFNNRWRHSVRHNGKMPRVNLFVDYYPNPGLLVRNPLKGLGVIGAAPVIN